MTRLRLCDLSPEQREAARAQLGDAPAPALEPTPGTPVSFFAGGLPATKGSTVSFVDAAGDVITKGDNKRTKGWQRVVAAAALAAGVRPWPGAVRLELTFFLPRPRDHYGKGKRADKVRPGAPPLPLTKPDGDKLERAMLDALTGVAYTDDSRVAGVRWAKAWAPSRAEPGVHVLVVPDKGEA